MCIRDRSYISEAVKPYVSFNSSYFSNRNSNNVNRNPRIVHNVQYSISKQNRWKIEDEVEKSFEMANSEGKHIQITRTGDDLNLRWYTYERIISVKDSKGFSSSSTEL